VAGGGLLLRAAANTYVFLRIVQYGRSIVPFRTNQRWRKYRWRQRVQRHCRSRM